MNLLEDSSPRWRVRVVGHADWRAALLLDPSCEVVDDPAAPVDVELQATASDEPAHLIVGREQSAFRDSLSLPGDTPSAIVVSVCRVLGTPQRQLRAEREAMMRLAQRLEQAEEDSRRDFATGLLNRRGWRDWLRRRDQDDVAAGWSVALLDLDDFKRINDAHGLAAGDLVLKGVAAALQGELRAGEAAARWGGDEFVVAVPGLDAVHAAQRMAAFQAAVSRADSGLEPSRITASLGWAGPQQEAVSDVDRAAQDEKSAEAAPLERLCTQLLAEAETRLRNSKLAASNSPRRRGGAAQ